MEQTPKPKMAQALAQVNTIDFHQRNDDYNEQKIVTSYWHSRKHTLN